MTVSSLRRSGRRFGAAAYAALFACALASVATRAIAADATLAGQWRVIRGVAAPWTDDAGAPQTGALLGARIRFEPDAVRAPAPLGCRAAVYTPTTMPPEGLFQSGLENPAMDAAALGLAAGDISGVSLSCDAGVFEFHAADTKAMLFALDNVIWTMSRAPGALAPASTPAGVVEDFLEAHFAGDMYFVADRVSAHGGAFSAGLRKRMRAYFAAARPADEPPPINGDPFTDSQDYPARFAVGKARVGGGQAVVPVTFADAYGAKTIEYLLLQRNGRWRIDDIRYPDGALFSALLAP